MKNESNIDLRVGIIGGSKKCPVCGNSVRVENLESHLKKVHPREEYDLDHLLDDDERKSIKHSGGAARPTRMTKGAKRAAVLGVVFIAILAAVYLVVANRARGQIYADHNYYNFGMVQQTKTSHTFTFSNSGNADLTIERIWTSCGCTTAKLVLNGVESPEFGMPGHGGYSGPWEAKMRPGDSATLVTYYDATNMPDLYTGERYVYVDSDDPANSEYQFTIAVQEVP